MSNMATHTEQECRFEQGCGALSLIIHPNDKDLGGFTVRRCLPNTACRSVGPWIFFDHMGPAEFSPGNGIDVRPHPHINIATVSYLFDGEILHRDSLGSEQVIRPGDINLMVAGKGIVHSERERPEVHDSQHRVHGLQLWLSLPESEAEMEPEFHHYPAEQIPHVDVNGAKARVIMGSAFGVISPVKTFAETLYVEMHLQPGQQVTLPMAQERAVYVVSGSLCARDIVIPMHAMGIFNDDSGVVIEATSESRIVIIGGANLGERKIVWNFVAQKEERINSAVEKWKMGLFPKVPGDTEEFIPFPG
ncbi:pirin family protein [Microbulbifer pacificus]|uniref:pirin family protein n=1 Tax=Microbulbifer pacificus TaxID=407164 RepID=UPI000CF49D5D|nr:pirin family protein [Microbulbifer pacificus]